MTRSVVGLVAVLGLTAFGVARAQQAEWLYSLQQVPQSDGHLEIRHRHRPCDRGGEDDQGGCRRMVRQLASRRQPDSLRKGAARGRASGQDLPRQRRLRGRIAGIYRHEGTNGQQIAYDVRLVNGKRGVVTARMLRVPTR